MAAVKTLSINEVAIIIEAEPRMIRKVLRASIPKEDQPGRGATWRISEKEIDKLREKVNAYSARAQVIAKLSD